MIDFFVTNFLYRLQNQTWVLLNPNLEHRFYDEIHGLTLLTSKIRLGASMPHLMPPHVDVAMEPFVGCFLSHKKIIRQH
jgi:hypothetical protein